MASKRSHLVPSDGTAIDGTCWLRAFKIESAGSLWIHRLECLEEKWCVVMIGPTDSNCRAKVVCDAQRGVHEPHMLLPGCHLRGKCYI